MNDLDARGLLCPLPVARARARLKTLSPGEQFDILADDPLARIDLQVFCARERHDYLGHSEAGGKAWRISLRKGAVS